MNFDITYKIEYTLRNDFLCCNLCRCKFTEDEIRIAVMVQSKHNDRKDPLWHHKQCFFQEYHVKSIEEIENFAKIKYNDQTDILKHIDPRQKAELKTIRDEPFDASSPKHFGIEYATSDKDQCNVCNLIISRNEIRIRKDIYDSNIAAKFGKEIIWNHVHCFVLMRNHYEFRFSGHMLPGFDGLQAIHQHIITDVIRSLDGMQQPHSSGGNPRVSDNEYRNEIELERTIAEQTTELMRVRQALQIVFSEEELQLFLIFNNSDIVDGLDNLLDRCADILTFGALYKCQKCNRGDMIFTKTGYTCNGMINEWVKCGYFEEKPLRLMCTIPEEMKQKRFFSTCTLAVEHRAIRKCKTKQNVNQSATKSANVSLHCHSTPKMKHIKLKDGSVVDPKSALEDVAHVFRLNGVLYTTALTLTDIQENKNSYYKIQVLESDHPFRKYWLFSSWGRIGTEIGNFKVESYPSSNDACHEFKKLFEMQTGNDWKADRLYKKIPGKFYPIDINYIDNVVFNNYTPSTLSFEVEELMKLLFDIETMKRTMEIELQLDMERMPLGKLSTKQLEQATRALIELESAIMTERSKIELIGLSEKFFTLIPFNFGLDQIPILDTLDKVNEKRVVVNSLSKIENAYSMMFAGSKNLNINSYDAYYEQLNADIHLVNRNSPEYEMIGTYVLRSLEFDSIDLFTVNRQGENARYAPYRDMNKRRLLWHGTLLTNFASIITNGLKIVQSRNGRMYGDGIYFADVCAKSFRYCDLRENTILLILAEVASYNTHEGNFYPDPEKHYVRDDGLIVPFGPIIGAVGAVDALTRYSEYVVVNEDHIKIEYLVKLQLK